jgi:predicted small secreted protein
MLSIFFFAVIAAVCTQIFSSARLMSRKSEELAGSVNAAANVAEYFGAWDGSHESWKEMFPDGVWEENNIWYQAYDEDWQQVDKGGEYVVVMRTERSGDMINATITAQPYGDDVTEVIYELDVAHCLQ